ncbi:LLM class flavin-dependent oxidoreductase [Actinoplanes sp. NPDC051851]|uniref:LLM class flavin-dependent oxidoreductase n=1 Tax=Actinoplanes sp. NPDC051851 TaxID=3154753 RepID=UPI00342E7A09
MTILGATFTPDHPPERLLGAARAAEEAGVAELWLWEDCFQNGGIAAAAAALAVTTRLRVGIGILPVPFRNVALCAMEIATLRRMFGERAIAGIGHGVQDWMTQVGERAASPLTLLREYTSALRALLHGETVTTNGRYVRLDAVRLDWPLDPPPSLLIGATGPKTLALAGELADGTILSGGTTPDGLRAAKRHIAATREHEIVLYLAAATGPTAAERLRRHREQWGEDALAVIGEPAEIAAAIREYADAGATTVVVEPLYGSDIEEHVRFVGEQLQPLVG